ncbi:very short patch repair endonuclease [Caenimonas soli]|uniref:very short patch repair endonuclease n=1 Tax=Caenimonas soli TaxID=2735555 RepID=UPI0015541B07|nr:DNA mismatch endonuclease Vsr [Caenimonas soli]
MADVFDAATRSSLMGRIKSHGNRTTELKLIEVFRANGMTGWRRKQPLFGKPDFVFRKQRVCVFVDGCFWHGCLKCYREPTSNATYWAAKVRRNKARDRRVSYTLRGQGWTVLRVWEHQLAPKGLARFLGRMRRALGH